MRKRETDHHKSKRRILLVVLLAVLCVGGSELIACRFFAPPLYQQITQPVRKGAHTVIETSVKAASKFSAWLSGLTSETETLAETDRQIAGDPAIISETAVLDPTLTEFKEIDDREILTGGIIPVVYFNQGEEPWSDEPYGSDDIGGYGCGPSTMAMAVSSMTEEAVDPSQMAQWAVDHKYWAKSSGSYLSIVSGTSAAYKLEANPISERTPEAIQEALLSGNLLVALMGPGHFTQSGHFILIRGITLSGKVLIADSNSRERSLMGWDSQLILDELSTSTNNGAPLWVLSQGDM